MEGSEEQEQIYLSQKLDYSYKQFLEKGRSMQNCFIDKYIVYDKIGEGSFGCVYRGMDDVSKKQVAVKVIDMREIHEEKNQKMKQIKMRLADTEPKLMQMCNSPNLLKCYDVYQNQDLKILMLEYCNGKTLQEEIDQKKSIPENQAATILRHIINGLIEMHRHKIVHRDLKADNIMSHNGTYKIIDFGFSKKLDIAQEMMEVKGTSLGTITTMAPEVMSRMPYGLKADIWSVGIIFFQMIYGIYPYDSQTAQQMYRQIRKSTVFASKTPIKINGITPSQLAYDFLQSVIVFNTNQRPNWKQVSDHPLIKNINDQAINQRFLKQCQVIVDQKLNYDEEINQNTPIMSSLKTKIQRISRRPQNQIAAQIKQPQKPIPKAQQNKKEKDINKLKENREQQEEERPHYRPFQRLNQQKLVESQPDKKQQNIVPLPKKQQVVAKQQESVINRKKLMDLMMREEEQEKKKAKQKQQARKNQAKTQEQLIEDLARKIEENKKKELAQQRQSKRMSFINEQKQVKVFEVQKKVVAEKKKEMNYEQAQQFAWTEIAHLQCLKTQLIFREIISPIEMGQLIKVQGRRGVEFIYLLIARCLNNMSPVQQQHEKRKKQNKLLIDNLYVQIDSIYRQVCKKFQQSSSKLTSVQNRVGWQIYDFWKKKTDKDNFSKRDIFLTGIQNMEYKKSQQIEFTYNYYKQWIQKDLKQHPNGYLVCQRMEKYVQINNITIETIKKRKKDFNMIVQQILTKK